MKKTIMTLLSMTLAITVLMSQTLTNEAKLETTPSFFALYEKNRHAQIPNYVTLDFILTATYLFKQQSITQMEEEEMFGLFKDLAGGMKETLLEAYAPEKEEALAYVLVLNALLGTPSSDVPKKAWDLALEELTLITKHQDIATSPIAKVKMDYTQYKIRAKYTKNAKLSSYFLALKYMSYMPFMVNAHQATGVSKETAMAQMQNALYLAQALEKHATLYTQIEKKLKALSGKGDDLSLVVLGDEINSTTKAQDYVNSLKQYPKINERIIDTTQIETEDIPRATLALKLLPSRFSVDGYIFSALTYPNVGKVKGEADRLSSFIDGKHVRGYPTIMDIAAVFVDKLPHESQYENYKEQVASLKKDINLTHESIYDFDFAIYKQLLEDNRTNSFKGYYTQSKYIMNLYQKQSYTGGLKGMFFDSRTEAHLEDNISKVLDLVIAELRLFPHSQAFGEIVKKLRALDKKEIPYTKKEIIFLNNVDNLFKNILLSTDAPIKVDIHTNPVEGKVMYEALDAPRVVYHGQARGAVYVHREYIDKR